MAAINSAQIPHREDVAHDCSLWTVSHLTLGQRQQAFSNRTERESSLFNRSALKSASMLAGVALLTAALAAETCFCFLLSGLAVLDDMLVGNTL